MSRELFYNMVNWCPNKNDLNIQKCISLLGQNINDIIRVPVIPEIEALPGNCFVNVFNKINKHGGKIVYGWMLRLYDYMLEAEFHAVWESPAGLLYDITPIESPIPVNEIMLCIDHSRKFIGKRTDNFRMNITENELVNDIIKVEEAIFRFIDNHEETDADDRIIFKDHRDTQRWTILKVFSTYLECLIGNNGTVNSNCFCGSEKTYKQCHREQLFNFLSDI